jgi:TfoX N-terminal domain
MTGEERYAELVERMLEEAGVSHGNDPAEGKRGRFGRNALKCCGRIFAMLSEGRLVVKIPRARVDEFVAAGEGGRFDPRRDGRLMKEWFVVSPDSELEWEPLAREALAFASR